jgi:hypothetical protein
LQDLPKIPKLSQLGKGSGKASSAYVSEIPMSAQSKARILKEMSSALVTESNYFTNAPTVMKPKPELAQLQNIKRAVSR